MNNHGKVYIIGAGPGDPELLTLKAKRIIDDADVIIYADSLVPAEIAGFAKPGAQVYGSKEMALPEIMEVTLRAVSEGKTVARIQSGDPSLYGATLEQMRILEREQIDYEIIPGVSAVFAAAECSVQVDHGDLAGGGEALQPLARIARLERALTTADELHRLPVHDVDAGNDHGRTSRP